MSAAGATPDASFWRGKRVLLTGHTGFKGAWLALWLRQLGADVTGLALGLKTWSADVVVCTHGARLTKPLRARLDRNGIQVRTEPIAQLEHADGALSRVVFASGDSLPRNALFFATGQHPQSSLAIALGCTLNRRGTVKTGTVCDTNVPRLYVAGDASRDAQFVVVAAAEGVKAACAINKALQLEELKS